MVEGAVLSRTVIKGGLVFDGQGGDGVLADVVIDGAHLEAVETAGASADGARVLDATGLAVCPGFIDVHSHADNAPLLDEHDTSKILQGVTTEVVGNCGLSLAPRMPSYADELAAYCDRFFPALPWTWTGMDELFAEIDAAGCVTNMVPLVGHGTVRLAAMGMADRDPTAAEIDTMRQLVEQAVEAGVFGLSSGLIYPPGVFSETGELAELVSVLPPQLVYATHIRGEGPMLLDSLSEGLEIARRAGRLVQFSHLKAAGREQWGLVEDALELLDRARAEGLRVGQDVYPYAAASSMLTLTMPPWAQEGGEEALLARLTDPETLVRLRHDVEHGVDGWENEIEGAGYDGLLIASTGDHRFEGKTIAELAQELGCDPFDAVVHVLVEERLNATMVMFSMSEDDVRTVLAHEHSAIGSDGLPPGTGGQPHPRLFGTFPRVLGLYARDEQVFPLGEAVRRMTSLPASTFGLEGRGALAAGSIADVVVFDPASVQDDCDFRDSVRPPQGIRWVLQGGEVAVEGTTFLGKRLGRRLVPAVS